MPDPDNIIWTRGRAETASVVLNRRLSLLTSKGYGGRILIRISSYFYVKTDHITSWIIHMLSASGLIVIELLQ